MRMGDRLRGFGVPAAIAAAMVVATTFACGGEPPIERRVSLTETRAAGTVSAMVFGTNLSYFNDLDEVWREGDLARVLRGGGVGALRYPGGEETSRFHWEHPGVNGYTDLWNEDHWKQDWQSTWVAPEDWATNEAFMDFDEFIANARLIGAEPLVGINMSSGVRAGRVKDSIDEAVRWVRYAKERGYGVRWWYFDNEPWHHNTYVEMDADLYGALCVRFAEAMRGVDPEARFIANPVEGSHAANWGKLRPFLEIAGGHIDMLDFHWYWEWARASWDRFAASKPLKNSSKWREYDKAETYTQLIRRSRRMLDTHGFDHIALSALEWNAGPSRDDGVVPPSPRVLALIHAEMLMQFVQGGLDAACVWPLFYQIRDHDHDTARRSWFGYAPPHEPTPAFEVVRMLSASAGGVVRDGGGAGIDSAVPVVVVVSRDNADWLVFALNKREGSSRLVLDAGAGLSGRAVDVVTFGLDAASDGSMRSTIGGGGAFGVDLPPMSLTRVTIGKKTRPGDDR